jgi:hypothetical protein
MTAAPSDRFDRLINNLYAAGTSDSAGASTRRRREITGEANFGDDYHEVRRHVGGQR